MGVPEHEITPQQERAIEALLSSTTRSEAAAAAEVGESTLYRWLNDQAFIARYRLAQRELHDHAMARLQDASSKAVSTLSEIMTDPDAKASARVTAAKVVLDLARASIGNNEIEQRLSALEQAQSQPTNEEPGNGQH